MKKMVLSFAAPACLVWLAVGCGDSQQNIGAAPQVRGMVVEVRGEPFATPDYLKVVDNDGREWEFAVAPTAGFNTSHLRDHMNRAEAVTVHFSESEQGLVAQEITD